MKDSKEKPDSETKEAEHNKINGFQDRKPHAKLVSLTLAWILFD